MKKGSNVLLMILFLAVAAVGCRQAGSADAVADAAASLETDGGGSMEAIAEGNNTFAIDLYRQLKGDEGNLFISPYSISTALAMTYAGARGETASQMAGVLHLPADPERAGRGFSELQTRINAVQEQSDVKLRVANGLWASKDFPFREEYLEQVREHYEAMLEAADFRNSPDQVRQRVNRWVEERTEDRIKDLLPTGTVSEMTRLILANAIYFKGAWENAFDKGRTRPAPFRVSPERTVQVDMMGRHGSYGYLEDGTVEVLRMNYGDGELSMIVILPKQVDGLARLEDSLSLGAIDGWLKDVHPVEIGVLLPRFKIESKFELGNVLSAMGMENAFSLREADFSGMSGDRGLFISSVIHQSYVDVNEEGTEAAAATGIVMRATSAMQPREFRADHPFLFLIRDNGTGSILFMGRVVNPS